MFAAAREGGILDSMHSAAVPGGAREQRRSPYACLPLPAAEDLLHCMMVLQEGRYGLTLRAADKAGLVNQVGAWLWLP